jgi:RNA polymerase-binding transcription factor DksA
MPSSDATPATRDTAWARLVPHLLQLRRRLDRIDAARRAPRDPDLGEQALAAEGDEVDAAIGAALRDELHEAEAALERIASGGYGRCLGCDEPIAEARLRALPTALRCAACEALAGRRAAGARRAGPGR